ncbi:hypothetical protein GGP41_001625 [Bipolaris sorokiniana]|uniref:Uncharacterized protein n=1 Tax=Cochliobolus sativus TaxID=45130 RepID=A0A8H6DYH9_COCSA|nr:hypothetical protein GGP41_001625 [Bipolaris sorokiniana]
MANTSPTISLYLNGNLSFQLGQKGTSGTIPTLQVQMHDASDAATLVIPGYQSSTNTFDPLLALQGGLFDLFDVDTDSQISVPSSDEEPGRLFVEAGARNRWFDLKIDTHEDFWTQLLTPGHKYEIRWRNDGNFPWAYRGDMCLHKTPLRELHGLGEIAHVVDEDGEEVEWPYGIGCFDGREPFPSDNMFEELKPNVPYEKTFWLEKLDKETSNGGELEELESGQSYTGKGSKILLGAFSKWRRGTKEELLVGEEKDKEARWRASSEQMLLDISDPFKFKAI